MSRTIRLGFAASLALAAAAPAWAEDAKADGRAAAGGDAWYDEFYSAGAVSPAPAVVPASSRGAPIAAAAGRHPQKRGHAVVRARAREQHRPLARSR